MTFFGMALLAAAGTVVLAALLRETAAGNTVIPAAFL
jgi:hypothetical protein